MKRPFPPVALALVAAGLVLATPAASRDLFVNNLAGYTITAPILDAPNCEGPAFADVNLRSFEKALCLFHRPARSPEVTQQVVTLMEQAQTEGLPPVHQQLSALVTGLAECTEAERHLDLYRASGNQDLLERTYFCRDRRLAQAELNAIRWNHALFDYADGLAPARALDARLTEMGSCQAGALSPDFDAECGLITTMSETEIGAFVDAAAGAVITSYFSGIESPITAMFSRKVGRAEGLVESAAAGIADIKAGADAVNREYDALNTVYVAARDGKMGPIYDAYREAILRATAILDEFDRWKGGLFITTENINLMPKITERARELDGELTRVSDLAFEVKAAALLADIQRIINAEAEDRKTIAALCRVYYCELTSRRAMAGMIRACRRPALAANSICIGLDGAIVNGTLTVDFGGPQSVAIKDLCQAAGLDPAMTEVNMDSATAALCLSQMP